MNTTEVAAWVKRNEVVTLKADYTSKDPAISNALVELGNVGMGIPFYAVYPKDGGKPLLFDGLITEQQVLDTLAEAAGITSID